MLVEKITKDCVADAHNSNNLQLYRLSISYRSHGSKIDFFSVFVRSRYTISNMQNHHQLNDSDASKDKGKNSWPPSFVVVYLIFMENLKCQKSFMKSD